MDKLEWVSEDSFRLTNYKSKEGHYSISEKGPNDFNCYYSKNGANKRIGFGKSIEQAMTICQRHFDKQKKGK